MSELNNPTTRNVTPTTAPTAPAPGTDGAAGVYRRAVEAKPTGFSENPIGAMAGAVDKIGRAAGRAIAGKGLEGQAGLVDGEARLKAAMAAVKANPGSLEAKQKALVAALALLKDMSSLAPNDPRRVAVSQFAVRLAGQLGAEGIPFGAQTVDVRGLLRIAAQIVSRYGSPQDMQAAFSLEGLLKGSLPESSVAAVRLRDALMEKFGLSKNAQALIANGWAVREARAGEVPRMDLSQRTLVLEAMQENPSLGVIARAYWHDVSLRSPADRDGFIEAFMKVANQGSLGLSRKYREVRSMARRELQQTRIGVLGSPSPGPASTTSSSTVDESADMFSALAVFARAEDGGELPGELRGPLGRFYAER